MKSLVAAGIIAAPPEDAVVLYMAQAFLQRHGELHVVARQRRGWRRRRRARWLLARFEGCPPASE